MHLPHQPNKFTGDVTVISSSVMTLEGLILIHHRLSCLLQVLPYSTNAQHYVPIGQTNDGCRSTTRTTRGIQPGKVGFV